jgi:hypothetical protein
MRETALSRPKHARRWLVRALIYYGAFEAFVPFALLFKGGWWRIGEGAAFAVLASSAQARFGTRVAALLLAVFALYSVSVAVWVGVEGPSARLAPVAAAIVGVLGVLAAVLAAKIWHKRTAAHPPA